MSNMLSKIKNFRLVLWGTVFLVLVIGNSFLIKQTISLFNENQSLEASITDLEDKQKQLQAIKQDLKSVSSDYLRVQNLFVKDPVDFIQTLESIAKLAGASVSISSVTSLPLEGFDTRKEEVTVSMLLNGSKSQVEKSIKLLELAPYKLTIRNISFSSQRSNSNKSDQKEFQLKGDWDAFVTISVLKNR